MPKLNHRYWSCLCGYNWYAEFSDCCPQCSRKNRMRYFLDASEGNKRDSEKIGNYDPWKELDIGDMDVPVVVKVHTRADRRRREKASKEKRLGKIITSNPGELMWPWDMAL